MVSPVSGAVFERRLIEKYINENGCDPMNNEPLDVSQLVEIKGESLDYLKLFIIRVKSIYFEYFLYINDS